MDEHENAYTGLGVYDPRWAFGNIAAPTHHGLDPLAGMDTSLPPSVDGATLGRYALSLGDDALIMSHRLSEWCSNAPDLEEDIALANIALDLLGQARVLLSRAARADPSLVPRLPAGSPIEAEDALAFFRAAEEFRNVRLVEVPNGDFADAVVRLLLFSTWRLALWEQLRGTADAVLAALADKGVRELAYHRDYAAHWFIVLATGTEESRHRLANAWHDLWPLWPELWHTHTTDAAMAIAGVGVDPASPRAGAEIVLGQVLTAAEMDPPSPAPMAGVNDKTGRDGMHTEALSLLLAQMQSVARAHPQGRW